MNIIYESHPRLVLEYRPVFVTGALFSLSLASAAIGAKTVSGHGLAELDFWIGATFIVAAILFFARMSRTTERLKVSFQRERDTITILHKTLFGLHKKRFKLSELEGVEIVSHGSRGIGSIRFSNIALRLRGQNELVALSPRPVVRYRAEEIAQCVRNWVPLQ